MIFDLADSLQRSRDSQKTYPTFESHYCEERASLIAQLVKNSPANAGDVASIPGPRRAPGEGKGNPLQYSCLENSMDRGSWRATVHGVAKSWT